MQPLWVFSGREQPPPSLCPSAQALPQPRCCPGSPLVEDGSLWIKYRPHPPTPLQARLLRAVSLLQSLEVEGGGGSQGPSDIHSQVSPLCPARGPGPLPQPAPRAGGPCAGSWMTASMQSPGSE